MAYRNTNWSFQKILMIVFSVAFGVIALAISYQAMQRSTEGRSKAAEEQIIYKQWEFNGKDTEGWKVPVGTTLISGYLHLPITYQLGVMNTDTARANEQQTMFTQPFKQSSLTIDNTAVNTVLPVGNKQIKFMVAVGFQRTVYAINANPPVSTMVAEESRLGYGAGGPAPTTISGITYEEQQRNNVKSPQYTMTVSYATSDNPLKYIQIPSVTGMGDGQSREIAITIPNSINEMRMGALNVQFTNVPPGEEVRIDWIRLVGPKSRIILPCKGNAVKSVTIENRCTGLKAKSVSYQCADGFTGSVGNGSTCVLANTLRKQVQDICAQHRLCPITPTPTGCYYQQVQCVKAPCDPILVCPTPTPRCMLLSVCPAPKQGCYYQGGNGTPCSCGTLVCSQSDCCRVEEKQLGYQCVQNCGPPVVTLDNQEPTTYSCLGPDAAASRSRIGCPICLASNTMIATPNGDIVVTALVPGMQVWTEDKDGKRVAASIVRVSRTPVTSTHQVIHLVLSDGREVWASPNHPTTDGREMKDLRPGFSYDDALVTKSESILYWDEATYDLLPSGDTGYYWANGILMGSTLK